MYPIQKIFCLIANHLNCHSFLVLSLISRWHENYVKIHNMFCFTCTDSLFLVFSLEHKKQRIVELSERVSILIIYFVFSLLNKINKKIYIKTFLPRTVKPLLFVLFSNNSHSLLFCKNS